MVQSEYDIAYEAGHKDGYEQGKKSAILFMTDEVNRIINRFWFSYREMMQGLANQIDRELYLAIPEQTVVPYKRKIEKDEK